MEPSGQGDDRPPDARQAACQEPEVSDKSWSAFCLEKCKRRRVGPRFENSSARDAEIVQFPCLAYQAVSPGRRGAAMFESDSWLDWEPDPERAAREAVPTLEPYASLTRRQILDLMAEAKGGREWEFLQEYFLNTFQPDELAVGTEAFIKAQFGGVFGFEELCYLEGVIELAIRRRIAPREVGSMRRREGGRGTTPVPRSRTDDPRGQPGPPSAIQAGQSKYGFQKNPCPMQDARCRLRIRRRVFVLSVIGHTSSGTSFPGLVQGPGPQGTDRRPRRSTVVSISADRTGAWTDGDALVAVGATCGAAEAQGTTRVTGR